ncbi:MAG: nitrous oxide reductase family maturation protein NosD [Cyclobacteriaceae bacterium]|nr:nitrous oxide reductase family maturation protein NosD [Cyclobacteriaceae bacterium]
MNRRLLIIWCLIIGCWVNTYADTLDIVAGGRFEKINAALAAADSGDVLRIFPGLYKEGTLIIDKSVTLLGIDYPRIDGEEQQEIIRIIADHVVVKGLQVQNVGTSYTEDRAGIKLDGVQNVQIVENRLINCFFGVYLKQSNDCRVVANQIIGKAEKEMSSGNAIHLWYCKRIEVRDNVAEHHRDGIYLEFVDDSQVTGNTSSFNLRYGLHFMFSNYDDYSHNVFQSNGAGVAVMFSRNIRMNNNVFQDNWGMASYGLLLKEIYDGEIKENHFIKNTIGIYGESANRLIIQDNDFQSNGWALKILGSCVDNTFTGNNFLTNTFDLTTNSNNDYNLYQGNYWSGYSGYDLNRDGYGDVPHRPIQMFSYVVGRVDVSIILLRSLFVDLLNFAEKVTPVFIPEGLMDTQPLMQPRP